MNTTDTRHTAATLATTTVVTAALTIMSAIAPTASAHQADPSSGPGTHCVVVGSDGTIDIALQVACLKSRAAQYYVDHALELLHRRDAR